MSSSFSAGVRLSMSIVRIPLPQATRMGALVRWVKVQSHSGVRSLASIAS